MSITDTHVKNFKKMNRIYHSHEDEFIKSILKSSYSFIKTKCGDFSMDDSPEGAELVYNRSRYAYNDSIEFFDQNFITMVISFGLKNNYSVGETDGTE